MQNVEFRQSLAELMKNLSDRAARVQIVLAGVANDLQELTGYIPSIRRNVVGVAMPRMNESEIRALLRIGEQAAGIQFDDAVTSTIVLLANGSPYLVRLLAHHASMRALDANRLVVVLNDVWNALDRVIDEAHSRLSQHTLRQLERAPAADAQLLAAVARAANTPDGWFTARDIIDLLGGRTEAMAYTQSPSEPLSKEHLWRDAFLDTRRDGDDVSYRFRDEALPTYLWMLIARDRLSIDNLTNAPIESSSGGG